MKRGITRRQINTSHLLFHFRTTFPPSTNREDSLLLNWALPSCAAAPVTAAPGQPVHPVVLTIQIAIPLLNPQGLLLLFLLPNFFKSHLEIPIACAMLRRRAFRFAFFSRFLAKPAGELSKSRIGVQVLAFLPPCTFSFSEGASATTSSAFSFFTSEVWPELSLTFPVTFPTFFFLPRSCLSDDFFL